MSSTRTWPSGPRIYNLFPLLAGPLPQWNAHLERIRSLGFDWVFINPIHLAGYSGSLYAIKDHTTIDPRFIDPTAGDPEEQLTKMLNAAKALGLRVMVDLVINHTAFDCVLVAQHLDWYKRTRDGKRVRPGVKEGDRWVTWGDLFEIDNANSRDRGALWHYWLQLAQSYLDKGFSGFRCDAADMVPAELWQFLLHHLKQAYPEAVFCAEALGCPTAETVQLAQLGFDFIFNRSKWWDFTEPWCLEQYHQTAPIVPSISFPESHDTTRLATDLHGNQAAVKQRYAFAALFSAGVMMPIGFEYGFQRQLDVVKTTPDDWELPQWDLCDYITTVNSLKAALRVFNEEGPIEPVAIGNSHLCAFVKSTWDGTERAVIIMNKDLRHSQSCDLGRLVQGLAGTRYVQDISPDSPMAMVPQDVWHQSQFVGRGRCLGDTGTRMGSVCRRKKRRMRETSGKKSFFPPPTLAFSWRDRRVRGSRRLKLGPVVLGTQIKPAGVHILYAL